jgi:hypothetical protein
MTSPKSTMDAQKVLDAYFLDNRARLLDVALFPITGARETKGGDLVEPEGLAIAFSLDQDDWILWVILFQPPQTI